MTTSTTSAAERPVVKVEIFSDVVCPWCYIGKRRFEAGLALATQHGDLGVDIEVSFKPYQLDPRAAPGVAGPVFDAYAKKFGGPEKAEEIIGHVTATAAADGLEFRMDRAQRANTLLAHRLIWWSGQPDSPIPQERMKERLLQAYFMDGVHVGSPDALADAVADLGVDRDLVVAFLDSDAGIAEVAGELDEAREHGITAVPTYVFNDAWAVPGAQDPATFAKVIEKMAAKALDDAATT
ncbi:MAG: DsbA family oxidoreductase [Ilumatobacter sp.]|jgi:predicted DsbA family dithiol-disulfide isomerase|uniref:DsbA family oxidoreductase n=1 Tax=Ilumatobacter sp. TaxID=1967498 RepID=UPI00391C0E8A